MDHEEAMRALRSIAAGFDGHDLDRILNHFADDAVFDSPRGPDPWGQRYVGKAKIRAAFAGRISIDTGCPLSRRRALRRR